MEFKRYQYKKPETNPPEPEGWEPVSFGYWKMNKTWSQAFKDTYNRVDPPKKTILTEYEFENQLFLNLVSNVKSETLTFFELGAAIGDWCLEIAGIIDYKLTETRALSYRCLGVEGEPTHYRWGKEHFEKQGIKGEMLHAAVLDYNGKCKFTSSGDPATWYGQGVSNSGNIEIPCFTVDTLVKNYGFTHLDICHMDIQNSELRVLNGCKTSIENKVIDYFSIRTHSNQLHSEIEKLLSPNYNLIINFKPGAGIVDTPVGNANVYQDGIIIAERKGLQKERGIDEEKFIKGVQGMRLRIGILGMPLDAKVFHLVDKLKEAKIPFLIYDPEKEKDLSEVWKTGTATLSAILDCEIIMIGGTLPENEIVKREQGMTIDPAGILKDWESDSLENFQNPHLKMLIYQRPEKKIIEKLLKYTGDLFIDVGAFLGEYSINLADQYSEVWAFEPAKDSQTYLEENLKRFQVSNVKVYPEALFSRSTVLPLYRKTGHHGGMTGLKEEYLRGEKQERLETLLGDVKTKTLDEVVGQKKVSFIKIDVEGTEKEILLGGKAVLKNTERILIEVHDLKEWTAITELLKEAGFNKFTDLGDGHLFAERE